jgi:hypothetical protein
MTRGVPDRARRFFGNCISFFHLADSVVLLAQVRHGSVEFPKF